MAACPPLIFLQISRIYKVNNAISQLLHKSCVPTVVIYNLIKGKGKILQCDVKT
jgi:hypothetical protein